MFLGCVTEEGWPLSRAMLGADVEAVLFDGLARAGVELR
jgi:hypothetical protein